MDTDICVVGGGPAGLAAALAARRHGFSVVLVDRAVPPIDKACGEGLMPDGVEALRELGIDAGSLTGVPFRGIRFLEERRIAEAALPGTCGLGIRRVDLQRLLLTNAEDAGVMMHWGSSAERVGGSQVKIGGEIVNCRWIVGADGAHSRLRQQARLLPRWVGLRRIGLRQHFRAAPWSDFVEVYWRDGAQAYVTPVGENEVCVAVLGGARGAHLSDLALFPELSTRLAGAKRISPARGAISMSTRLARVTRDRLALIGDASGAVDAVTGEGIALALRQALSLGKALAAGNLDDYEAAHARMTRLPRLAARLLVHLGTHNAWRWRVLETLAEHPRAFERLLAVHVGSEGLSSATIGVAGLMLGLVRPRGRPAGPVGAIAQPPLLMGQDQASSEAAVSWRHMG